MKESLALLLVRACVHVYVVGGCGPGVPGPVGDCWLPVDRGPRWAGVGGTRRMGVTVTVGVGIALLPRLHRGNRPLPTKSLLIVCQVTPRPGLPSCHGSGSARPPLPAQDYHAVRAGRPAGATPSRARTAVCSGGQLDIARAVKLSRRTVTAPVPSPAAAPGCPR